MFSLTMLPPILIALLFNEQSWLPFVEGFGITLVAGLLFWLPVHRSRKDLRLRDGFLIVAAFCAGASVMIVELAGNRFLAPMFGNSLYTWTGLIGVILISISCGYYLGGYLADRRPQYVYLVHLLALSAVIALNARFRNVKSGTDRVPRRMNDCSVGDSAIRMTVS